jgi:hypothetical protein
MGEAKQPYRRGDARVYPASPRRALSPKQIQQHSLTGYHHRPVISIYKGSPTALGRAEIITVNYFIPYYVNDVQSDIRGIKCGWYAMDERGKLGAGPFLSAGECLEIGAQAKGAPTSKWLH